MIQWFPMISQLANLHFNFPTKIKSSHQTTDGGSSTTGQACGFCLCSTDRFCLYSLGAKAKLLLPMLWKHAVFRTQSSIVLPQRLLFWIGPDETGAVLVIVGMGRFQNHLWQYIHQTNRTEPPNLLRFYCIAFLHASNTLSDLQSHFAFSAYWVQFDANLLKGKVN